MAAHTSHVMGLWVFSSSVYSFFKRACATIQWYLVGPFVYFHTSCVRTANALARLRGCAGSPEPSLVAYDKYHNLMSWLTCIYPVIIVFKHLFSSIFRHYHRLLVFQILKALSDKTNIRAVVTTMLNAISIP